MPTYSHYELLTINREYKGKTVLIFNIFVQRCCVLGEMLEYKNTLEQ